MVILEKHGKALTFCPSQGVQTQDIPCHPLVPKESQHQGDLLLATSWSTPRRAKPSRQLAGPEALHDDWKLKIYNYILNIHRYTVNICEVMWNVNLGDGQNPNFKVLGFELSLDPNTTREKSWFSSSPLITNWAEAVSSTDLEDAHFAACWLQLHSGCSGL